MLALLSFIGIIEIESIKKPTMFNQPLTNTINKLSAEQSLFLDVSSPVAEQKKDPGYESTRERVRELLGRITNLIVFTHQVDLLRTCGLFPLVLHRPSHQKRDF